ncbi:hypothetical protein PHYSODRAFT_530204 [Phytophthora sojae]|uniref:GIY-YIG domain-containing protein n=1 Tax=Phytophthora sojae (strain P6497) TaxID=1094619 RepID=G5ACL1_PHYSP|nr:hypothetical protein PHYSODRAFT_530204 [Phytophthora sojae]EGZ07085.1 hypothetical protein PHYSODRAFT_530204 [Phytophthora sojae]|eukprot:XP_009537849.1 hypothetical protein PHYSODRAFT_530204 [Phytophthora sojae]
MIGHIYRVIHLESDVQYVGSTLNEPLKRWQKHKQHYHEWVNDKRGKCEIYPYFQEHGINKFKLIPIKTYDVVERKHLEAYESLWISKLACVNKVNPFQIKKTIQKAAL